MRGAVILFLTFVSVLSQTLPAVYYNIFFINNDGINSPTVEMISANGDGRKTLWSTFVGTLQPSLAFDGTFLYYVDGLGIQTVTTVTPPVFKTLLVEPNATCVAIGKVSGRNVILYGTTGVDGTSSLWQVEVNGTGRVPLVSGVTPSSPCVYMSQYDNTVMWTTKAGYIFTVNLASTTSPLAAKQSVLANATQGLAAVSGASSVFYSVGGTVRVAALDVFLGTAAPSTPLNDRLWLNGNTSLVPFTKAHGMCTLNGALILSTSTGLLQYFAPYSFSTTPSRYILQGLTGIQGVATDLGVALVVNMSMLVFFVLISVLFM